MNINQLWEELGELDEEDSNQALVKLFVSYEEDNEKGINNEYCKDFFKRLSLAMAQAKECNLNRR